MAKAVFWRLDELVERLGVRPLPTCRQIDLGQRLSGISSDSRSLAPGSLFVPLRGENFDGHDYIAAAIAAGALAVLVENSRPDLVALAQRWPGILFLPVADTLKAFGTLARIRLDEIRPKIFAITGSNGKTTTRRMLAAILGRCLRVHQSQGNFNNLVGLPMTVFTMPDDCEAVVLEMGMNRPGEIAALSAIARPDILLLTNVTAAHLEGLGSLEAVTRAKCEALAGVRPGGVVIYNVDDEQLAVRVPAICSAARPDIELLPVTWHGAYTDENPEPARASEIWLQPEGLSFVYSWRGVKEKIDLPCWGRHNVMNAALAIAAAQQLPEVTLAAAAAGLAAFSGAPGRLERYCLGRGIILVHDAYNANPASMEAALSEVAGRREGRFLALVLGGMNELGSASEELHAALGRRVAEIRPGLLLLIGELAAGIGRAARAAGLPNERIQTFPEGAWDEARTALEERLPDASLVLVKGSRSLQLERVVEPLRDGKGRE